MKFVVDELPYYEELCPFWEICYDNADKDEWSEGTIYNPASGKTYNCYMKFESGNRLKIRGFIGSSWMGLGKTAYWTKEAAERK